jgi:DNA-binding transcriptional regulator GbsR (MarR family)
MAPGYEAYPELLSPTMRARAKPRVRRRQPRQSPVSLPESAPIHGAEESAALDEPERAIGPEGDESLAPRLEEPLAAQLPVFEQFFKTFGFKRVHGRIWGLLVLSGQPLSAREISLALALSQGATSTALNELIEWGAVTTEFDSPRRCHLHSPVSNTLSIVATVMRRREQVAFQQFRGAAARTLTYVQERYGERDPRVLTLRSIVSTCEIAESVVQLVVGAVANALDDSESLLHKALTTALKVGVVMPSRLLLGNETAKALRAAAKGAPPPPREEPGG